ncbi:MAG TPA: hypothetical protein VFU22_10020, partial [Roseiflexaceae bacterium]|nr:hypothetical protein [Roseiflexaceae bacterium]
MRRRHVTTASSAAGTSAARSSGRGVPIGVLVALGIGVAPGVVVGVAIGVAEDVAVAVALGVAIWPRTAQTSRPCVPSSAVKNSASPRTASAAGLPFAVPGAMSCSRTVPARVPSLCH